MPLRASKMKGFILGFHRLVWCPKWTPASNNSFTPILITSFPFVKSLLLEQTIPRNTGLILVLLWPPASNEAGHLRPFTLKHRGTKDNRLRARGKREIAKNRP